MRATHVIHAVGPIYADGKSGEDELLASAYRSSLSLAAEHNLSEIAFPCISTGVFGFPKQAAAHIAINTVVDWLRQNERPETVTFCCFEPSDEMLYSERLDELGLAVQD